MKKLLTITTALGLAFGAWTAVPALAQGGPGGQKGKGPFGKQQGPQDGSGKQGKGKGKQGKGKQGKGKQGKGKQGGPNAPTQTPPTN